ncbi:MAG: endonuclease III [Betaproteobacteria bacterium]|nr:MAG: endonuclease III [Betaproteobacteria bacterium]
MNAEKRHRIFAKLAEANPDPKTELEYGNPFQLVIAVLLSAQTTDKAVNIATRRFFPFVKTPHDLVALGVSQLEAHIKTIGLYRNKAKNAVATAQQLIDLHGGKVPHDRGALEALPGVGRKTANVVLNEAFGEATFAVDTHVFRVSNRMKLAPGKNVDEVERKLMKFTPPEFLKSAHHWLILHGRYVCTARSPKCPECAVFDDCEFAGRIKIRAQATVDQD